MRPSCAIAWALLSCIPGACLPLPGQEADWPQFRGGPGQRGLCSVTLPSAMTLRWTFKTDGVITGSPVILNGVAYIGSRDGKCYAVGVADGVKRWEVAFKAEIEASPAVVRLRDGNVVVIGDTEGNLTALDPATGAERWHFKAGDKICGAVAPFVLQGETQLVVGSYDNSLHCLDAATGLEKWSYATGSYINGTPAIGAIAGVPVAVVGGCDAHLHVVDLNNGSKLQAIEMAAYVASSVALDGTLSWVGDYGNEVACVDLASGTIVWRYEQCKSPFFSSAAVTDSLIVIGSRDRRVIALNRTTGKEAWSFTAQGNVDGSPVIGGARVLVGADDGRLYLLDLATGACVWSYEIGGKIGGSPAISGGIALTGCEDGSLYAFTMKESGNGK
jgi:outer membrane protein assembly factor BamB